MRNVDTHLLEDEAVTHYINSHQQGEPVHVDTNGLALNVQDETGRVVTVMPGQSFPSQMTRHLSVGEGVEGGAGGWSEELLEPELRLAALVAHLAHQSRAASHQPHQPHHKVSSVREIDSSVLIDAPMRLFNGQTLDTQQDSIVVHVPPLPPLPPLQGMKRCQDTGWFNKDKNTLKTNGELIPEPDGPMLELAAAGASPAQNKQNKKSLPHKKRISRKLKRSPGGSTPQQDLVVINCNEEVQQEEILPDNYVTVAHPHPHHPHHLAHDAHQITHEVRACFICQLCGEFYGEEQLKFYQHLKQHYEPHDTIIIQNPGPDLTIDKMATTCIVESGAALPDSLVELSLGGAGGAGGQGGKLHPAPPSALYTSADKAMYTNKVQYSMANTIEKEVVVPAETPGDKAALYDTETAGDKADLYDTLDKLELYNCIKCNKTFRKQKQCEMHIKEAHNPKLEDMGEFSEPEDLMEGIHVAVEEAGEPYEQTLIPHLTVDNGHVHQEHVRHWYLRGSGPGAEGAGDGAGGGGAADGSAGAAAAGCGGAAYCPVCPAQRHHQHAHLKEEVLQRILDVSPEQNFADNIMEQQQEPPLGPAPPPPPPPAPPAPPAHPAPPAPPAPAPQPGESDTSDKKKSKKCECVHCGRVFFHRNSLLYHMLSHRDKQHECTECGKGFYTSNALKIHSRVHNGSRPYKCEVCGRDFRQWSDLKYHKVSLHSNQKHYKCEYCGKEFARRYSLSVHRRIHTGEKNYKCEYCNKTFRASSYRLSHMRVHTGDRPYKCPVCEKGFRAAGDLRRHMFTHDKVRNRLDEQKKPKDDRAKTSAAKDAADVKPEPVVEDNPPVKLKKIAVASTTRPPLVKTVEKKQKPAKKVTMKKGGAPNVTVAPRNQTPLDAEYTDSVEVFDTRPDCFKYRVVYSDHDVDYDKDNLYRVKEYTFKDIEQDRELTAMRPIYRSTVCEQNEKTGFRAETTDGKMQVYTHVEKSNMSSLNLADIRIDQRLDRERSDLHGEGIENGFLENLTALYNISTV